MMDISSRLVKRCRKFIEPYRVTDGRGFKLSRYDPGDLGKLGKDSKKEAVDKLEKGIELLEQLQEVLYASESHALLVVVAGDGQRGKGWHCEACDGRRQSARVRSQQLQAAFHAGTEP